MISKSACKYIILWEYFARTSKSKTTIVDREEKDNPFPISNITNLVVLKNISSRFSRNSEVSNKSWRHIFSLLILDSEKTILSKNNYSSAGMDLTMTPTVSGA